MFLSQVERYGDRLLYRYFSKGRWRTMTWNEALARVQRIALGLVSLGLRKGDRVALFAANRVEWSLIDWADICMGALTVPIYASSTPSQVARLLDHCGSTLLFIESAERLAKLGPEAPALGKVDRIVLIETPKKPLPANIGPIKVVTLEELEKIGSQSDPEPFRRSALALCPEDDLTIIYTSGTTGEPKGVLTTHGHYLFMIEAVDAAVPSTDQEVNLQFLPFAHSFGRLEHFMVVAKGYTCGFARSAETMAKDLLTIRPTILFSIPRLYENSYERIRSRMTAGGLLQKQLFHLALVVGRKRSRYQVEGRPVPWWLRPGCSLAHRMVFSKVQASFGGRLRVAISGGAALAPEIAEFFHAFGILILQGYGLTETSTVSHVNRVERNRFGSVGPPLQGVECRIAADGEILLRGANIFKGYYRDPEATREVLEAEGWFHTGDIGEIDAQGFLYITDRKKDLIVTSGGKKIAPQVIEKFLKTDPLISQAMVLGDRQRHLLALVTLKQERVREWCRREGLVFRDSEEMASHPRVQALIRERIRQKNKELAPFEAVRGFRILPRDFSVEGEELTPTLKLRRQVVMERYRDLIEEMVQKPRADL